MLSAIGSMFTSSADSSADSSTDYDYSAAKHLYREVAANTDSKYIALIFDKESLGKIADVRKHLATECAKRDIKLGSASSESHVTVCFNSDDDMIAFLDLMKKFPKEHHTMQFSTFEPCPAWNDETGIGGANFIAFTPKRGSNAWKAGTEFQAAAMNDRRINRMHNDRPKELRKGGSPAGYDKLKKGVHPHQAMWFHMSCNTVDVDQPFMEEIGKPGPEFNAKKFGEKLSFLRDMEYPVDLTFERIEIVGKTKTGDGVEFRSTMSIAF